MNSLSTYLNKNCFQPITRGLLESVRNIDIEKVLDSVNSFLKKRKVYTIPAIEVMDLDGSMSYVVLAFSGNNYGCSFNWSRGNTTSLHSICFTKDFDSLYVNMNSNTPFKWDVELQLKGASIIRALQLVADVMSGRVQMTAAALNKAVRDAQVWESCEDEDIKDFLTEDADDKILMGLKSKRDTLYHRLYAAQKKGKDTTSLQQEYDAAKAAYDDARVSIRNGVVMKPVEDPAVEKIQDRFEEEGRATPEERFSDMEAYIHNVVLGLDTSALICGAPGVGKTYRIMQIIKKAGKQMGRDYDVIKGKCTPLVLYQMLHDYQKKGQIVVIDDADSIITDDTSINIIKAATDSSDERVVSYGTSLKTPAPEDRVGEFSDWDQLPNGNLVYPRSFVYEGSIIIITNMNAGQIDTAIRSRAMICDLAFNTNEVLNLVRGLSPHIAPEILTPECKEKAFAYLQNLADSGAPMEISIRSFMLVAKLYLSDAPERDIERRIREQMKLKFARGGKKY